MKKGPKEESSSQELRRFEFFEILVRLAGAKFKETGLFKTYHESLQHLISHNLTPAYKNLAFESDWFRKSEIWQLDVADALFANLASLKKIY